jgi:hypothetical protein
VRGADPERTDTVVSLGAAALWNGVRKMRGRMDGAQMFPAGNFSCAVRTKAFAMAGIRSRATNGLHRSLRAVHWQPGPDSEDKASNWRIR